VVKPEETVVKPEETVVKPEETVVKTVVKPESEHKPEETVFKPRGPPSRPPPRGPPPGPPPPGLTSYKETGNKMNDIPKEEIFKHKFTYPKIYDDQNKGGKSLKVQKKKNKKTKRKYYVYNK
jgi:hypothetical protein